MKSFLKKKTLVVVIILGAVAVAGASVVRYRFLHSKEYRLNQALQDPRFKKMDAEVARLQAAVAAAPNDIKARDALFETYKKLGVIDQAIEQLEVLNRLKPDDLSYRGSLGDLYMLVSKPHEAELAYTYITKKWPTETPAWEGLATALYKQQKASEAIAASRMSVQLEPKNDNHHYILATCLLQYGYQFPDTQSRLMFFAAAKKELEPLLTKWPVPGEIHYQLARALDGMRDHKGAIKHYEEALKLMPTRTDIPVVLANLYISAADRTSARKLVDKALKEFPNVAALHDLDGQLIQTTSAPDAAQKAYEAYKLAVKYEGDNVTYLDHLGSSAVRVNKLNEAAQVLMESVKINENRSFPYQQLAAVFARLGDREHSNKAAEMAAKMVHNEQQLRQLQEIVQVYPDDKKLHIQLADRYRQLKMTSLARDMYLQILQFAPNDKHSRDAVAEIDRERNQPQQHASAKP